MVLSHLDPHYSSVWTEPSSSLIKIKSWRDGLNISTLFSAILHQSMRQFNVFHKFQSIMNSMHHPLLMKLKKAISQLSNSKVPRADVILAKVYKYGGPVLHRKLVTSSSPYGSKVLYYETSRMHLSFISTREKEITNSLTITTAYHSCP